MWHNPLNEFLNRINLETMFDQRKKLLTSYGDQL